MFHSKKDILETKLYLKSLKTNQNINSMTHILKPLLNNVDSGHFWALDPDLINIAI